MRLLAPEPVPVVNGHIRTGPQLGSDWLACPASPLPSGHLCTPKPCSLAFRRLPRRSSRPCYFSGSRRTRRGTSGFSACRLPAPVSAPLAQPVQHAVVHGVSADLDKRRSVHRPCLVSLLCIRRSNRPRRSHIPCTGGREVERTSSRRELSSVAELWPWCGPGLCVDVTRRKQSKKSIGGGARRMRASGPVGEHS